METSDVTHFSGAVNWIGVKDVDREPWLEKRRELVTASDVASILGYSVRSALKVYMDKTLGPEDEEAPGLDDPRFWGSILEQPILSNVACVKGWDYFPGGALLQSKKYPWLGATLDAEIDRRDGNGWIVLEGKTSQVTKEWDEDEQALPQDYLIQAHTQLTVSEAPQAVVFALLMGCRPCQIEIHPDPELSSLIVEESHEFMERVRNLNPPPADHRESSRRALERLHGDDDGSIVQLPPIALEWAQELVRLAEKTKTMERRQNEIRNLMRQTIGNATWGVLTSSWAPKKETENWRRQTFGNAPGGVPPEPVDGNRFFRWKKQGRGRVLRAMKNGPPLRDRPLRAAVAPPNLEDILRESVEPTNVVQFRKTRRRNRR